MIYITQLLYVKAGQEAVFDEFESLAIPIIEKYDGELVFRLRPEEHNYITSGTADKPYEIHLIKFPSQSAFDAFSRDDTRKQFLHLKEQSIERVLLVQGTQL